jgi:hypothetical protein
LDSLAVDYYGAKAAPQVRKAWTAFSEAFCEFPFHIWTLYLGPQHFGPANPLYLHPTGYSATMLGFPYDDLKGWRSVYPPEIWAGQMRKVASGFENGCALFAEAIPLMPETAQAAARRELGMFRAQVIHFASAANQAEFVLARDAGDRTAMRRLATDEITLAQELLPLVLADSRLGYESSNHYFYLPQDLLEKIINCRHILNSL